MFKKKIEKIARDIKGRWTKVKILICVDKNSGMMFNQRRQSQDTVLREKVLEICNGQKLWMNAYSAKQFVGNEEKIIVAEDFIDKMGEEDFCFVETFVPTMDKCDMIYLFNWNRKYPADLVFNVDLKQIGFKETMKEEFVGNTHEKITLKVYKRG